MSKEMGYTLYTCDRCAAKAYLKDGDTAVSDYMEIQYMRQGANAPVSFVLDSRCYQQWITNQSRRDYQFDKWLAAGASKDRITEANKSALDRANKYEVANNMSESSEKDD